MHGAYSFFSTVSSCSSSSGYPATLTRLMQYRLPFLSGMLCPRWVLQPGGGGGKNVCETRFLQSLVGRARNPREKVLAYPSRLTASPLVRQRTLSQITS